VPAKSFFRLAYETAQDPIIILLMVAATVGQQRGFVGSVAVRERGAPISSSCGSREPQYHHHPVGVGSPNIIILWEWGAPISSSFISLW
jgi:hypothetical protein